MDLWHAYYLFCQEDRNKKIPSYLFLLFGCLHMICGVLSLLDCLSEGDWLVYSVHTLGSDWGQWPVSAYSIPRQVWSRGRVLQGLQVKDWQHMGQCQKVGTFAAQELFSVTDCLPYKSKWMFEKDCWVLKITENKPILCWVIQLTVNHHYFHQLYFEIYLKWTCFRRPSLIHICLLKTSNVKCENLEYTYFSTMQVSIHWLN